MMGNPHDTGIPTAHYFVDEAGDPTLFDHKGRIIVGNPGCSSYFVLGKLEVDDPAALTAAMEKLRVNLLADPYFKGLPSMQPTTRKTALMFHAKDDLPEVRREVFRLLLTQKVRFYAVVRDKREAAVHESRLREADPKYRYRPNELYDHLVGRLFGWRLHRARMLHICFSQRGKSDRTMALKTAIATAVVDFERDFGVRNQAKIEITCASPLGNGGLQAVDYFLWALQRFYEFEHTDRQDSECRYVQMLWEQTGEVNDLDFLSAGRRGVLWGPTRPLTLDARTSRRRAEQ